MKLLIFTDNHFCTNSSIIKRIGTKYSIRLENQIKSINWLEDLAKQKGCGTIICLGDFFDKPDLTEQEITAIRDINWSNIPHLFLVGNHESTGADLAYNSTKILEGKDRFIINTPEVITLNKIEFCFLPYISEIDRKPLNEYFPERTELPRVILSHNDIKGIQMGPVMSKFGFDINEIDNSCDLFINGHLHNGQKVSEVALNLGNLTGKDFGEDASKYSHNVLIIDTDTFSCEFIENPHAFNFYKVNVEEEKDILQLKNLKSNAVVSIKCSDKLIEQTREAIANNPKIIESRLSIIKSIDISTTTADIADLSLDHIAKFIECCHENIENTETLEQELAIICR